MTNTYRTLNPIGSTAPKDLYDNASNFDDAINGTSPAWVDRFGRRRESLYGQQVMFAAVLARMGFVYASPLDYAAGTVLTLPNELIRKDGEYYKLSPTASLPYTTTGNWATESANFVPVGDANLRSELATPEGAELVRWRSRSLGEILEDTVNVKNFGAIGDGVTDDTAAVKAAIAKAESLKYGGAVWFPNGDYLITDTLHNDRRSDATVGRVSFYGADVFGTRISYSGAADALFHVENNQSPVGEQSAGYQTVSAMTLIGPSQRAGSIGLLNNLGAFQRFEGLIIQGFDHAHYCQDVDHSEWNKVSYRFNRKGLFGTRSGTPGPSSTAPNNWNLFSCALSNNVDYGAFVVGGSAFCMFGGNVEYNGSVGPAGFGIQLLDCGYEGGKGGSFYGTYFEANGGTADLVLSATTVNVTPMLGVVHTVAAEFHRNTLLLATNNILCNFGPEATVGKQSLVLQAASFKHFGGYVPSGATPYIAYSGVPASSTNFYDFGSYWGSDVEKPKFVQNLNKISLTSTRAGNQSIPSASPTQWVLDTKAGANPIWDPAFVGGGVAIPEDGVYQLSAFVNFASSASGQRVVTIQADGITVACGEMTGSIPYSGASSSAFLNKGQLITVNVIQTTGGAIDLVGAVTSNSRLTLTKIFG